MIPIGKHLERCEAKLRAIIDDSPGETNEYYDSILLPVLYELEKNTLKFNE